MPTSLVTGGAGFLGSHLCEALLEKGHRVICLDNLETGSLANIAAPPRRRIRLPPPRRQRADRRRRAARLRLPPRRAREPDRLPAPAAPLAEGRLLRHAPRARASRSGSAHGSCSPRRARCTATREVHPQPETYWGNVNPIGPRGVYDEAKRYAEALTMAYHRQQGVDTAIVRIFNTYGPRMRPNDGRAIPNFLSQALGEKPLTVFGDGSQTRSFCYVDDLIRGLVLLAESGEHLPVNIGNPGECTILELAEAVHRGDRVVEPDRLRGAAGRRPAGAPAGHHARPADSRLGARGSARRGAPPDAGIAREGHGACVGQGRRPPRSRSPSPSCLAPTASASQSLRIGIFDDGVVLYGEPDLVFPQLQKTRTQLLRVNLWWSGPGSPSRPASRSDPPTRTIPPTTGTRTTGRCASRSSTGSVPIFSIVGTPPWANAAKGWNVAPTNARDLQNFAAAAQKRYSGTFVNADGVVLPAREPLDGLERAEQPGLPEAAVPTGRARPGRSSRDATTRSCATPSSRGSSRSSGRRRSRAAPPGRGGTTTRTRAARRCRRSRSSAP